MPTIAISGRRRFGGFKAAMVASASSFAIVGAVAKAVAEGRVKIQTPPIITKAAAAPKPPHNTSRHFMVTCLDGLAWPVTYRADAASEMSYITQKLPSAFGPQPHTRCAKPDPRLVRVGTRARRLMP